MLSCRFTGFKSSTVSRLKTWLAAAGSPNFFCSCGWFTDLLTLLRLFLHSLIVLCVWPWTRLWPLTPEQFFRRSTSLTSIWEPLPQMKRRTLLQVTEKNKTIFRYLFSLDADVLIPRPAGWHLENMLSGFIYFLYEHKIIPTLPCPGAQWHLLSLLPVFPSFPSLLPFLPAYLGQSVDWSHFHWSRFGTGTNLYCVIPTTNHH